MGGGDNEITISALLDTVGFDKGTKKLEQAVKGVGNAVKKVGETAKRGFAALGRSFQGAEASAKRLIPILIGVGSAYGVISKAVSAFMSQNQKLSAQFNSIWTALGNVLGPIITQIITWVTTAVSYFLEFLRLLGLTSKTASQLSKKANQAGSELKKTIAGFDELNLLNGPGGGGAGGNLSDVDPVEWMASFAEALKKHLWDDAADIIIGKMNSLIAKIKSKAEDFGKKVGEILGGIGHIIARAIREVDWSGIGESIALFLNGLMDGISGEDIGTILVGKFTIAFRTLTGFLETLDMGELAQKLSGVLVGALNTVGEAIKNADWRIIGENIKKFFENVDWDAISAALRDLLKDAWDAAVDLLWGLLTDETGEEPPLVTSLRDLGEAIGKFIDAASKAWNEKIKPFLEKQVNQTLPKFFEDLAKFISDLAGILSGEINFWEFITNLNDLEKALVGIGAAMGVIKTAQGAVGILETISKIKGLFPAGTAAEAKGAADAVSAMASASGAATSGATGLLAALGPLLIIIGSIGAVLGFANEEAKKLAKEGYLEAGLSAAEYAENVKKCTEEYNNLHDAYEEAMPGFEQQGMVLTDLDAKYETMAHAQTQLADALGITVAQLYAEIEAADGDVTKIASLAAATQDAGSAVESSSDVVSGATGNMASTAEDDWGHVADEAEDMGNRVSGSVEDMSEKISTDFESGVTDMGRAAEENTLDVQNVMEANLGTIAGNAFVWGADLSASFADGIYSQMGSVMSAAVAVADGVHSILGFSEPEEGPLSDFHTYGPDMMKLYADGIEQNKSKVLGAVGDVAEGISDAMDGGEFGLNNINVSGIDNVMDSFADKIVGGFETMIERLQAIADNVMFTMPAVAGGGIVPYGVSGGVRGVGSSGGDANTLAAIQALTGLVERFESSVNNMQWVLKFGNERAVVREITRIQKQEERAKG